MTLWGEWQRLRAISLTDEEVRSLESSKEYRLLKKVHQYWGNQARAQRRKSYDRERHARIGQGKWSPDDPDRVLRKLRASWGRCCESVINILISYPELEPMPRVWSSVSRPDPRWIASNDNAALREALAPHVGQLWAIAIKRGFGSSEYVTLTTGPKPVDGSRGPDQYERDFLQCALFCQLREEALFRSGRIGNDAPPDEEPLVEPDAPGAEAVENSVYTSMTYHAESLRDTWGDQIPERILRHERFMKTGVDRR